MFYVYACMYVSMLQQSSWGFRSLENRVTDKSANKSIGAVGSQGEARGRLQSAARSELSCRSEVKSSDLI